jgi:hypothetical protein
VSIGDTTSVAVVSGLAKPGLGCISRHGGRTDALGVAVSISGALVVGGIEGAICTATCTDTFTTSGGVTQVVQIRPITAQGRFAAGYTVDKPITADSQDFNPSGCLSASEVSSGRSPIRVVSRSTICC